MQSGFASQIFGNIKIRKMNVNWRTGRDSTSFKKFDVINHTVEMKDARGLRRAVRHIFIGLVCAACVLVIILLVARS